MEIKLLFFGGRGTASGGYFKIVGHKLPDKYKPNSVVARYDYQGIKREYRKFDNNGDKYYDDHLVGPPNHIYPHRHYWFKDEFGNWHRTTYTDWLKGVKKWK